MGSPRRSWSERAHARFHRLRNASSLDSRSTAGPPPPRRIPFLRGISSPRLPRCVRRFFLSRFVIRSFVFLSFSVSRRELAAENRKNNLLPARKTVRAIGRCSRCFIACVGPFGSELGRNPLRYALCPEFLVSRIRQRFRCPAVRARNERNRNVGSSFVSIANSYYSDEACSRNRSKISIRSNGFALNEHRRPLRESWTTRDTRPRDRVTEETSSRETRENG